MIAMLEELSDTDRDTLRKVFHQSNPTQWVIDVAHEEGWRKADEEFLRREQERGREEMTALLAALGVQRPASTSEAADLVQAALCLQLPEGEPEGAIERTGPNSVRLRICNCPVYRRIEAARWRGVTACGSWHRRQGWYQAMGVQANDFVVAESKWGDEACEAVIDLLEV